MFIARASVSQVVLHKPIKATTYTEYLGMTLGLF
eukprot:SAG22_NODE_10335_length_540_cov_11.104308_1_plen_33_part_10